MSAKTRATVEDLYRVPDRGKAEIVSGEVVLVSPTGDMPARAGGATYVSLRGVERRGDVAEAGPAVPGWTMPVDELFD
jgi:hypothetical protein